MHDKAIGDRTSDKRGNSMRRNACRAFATVALAIVILVPGAAPAFAGTAYSNYSNFTCGSYSYRNQACVETGSYGASASTAIYSVPNGTIRPAGWYGALARLYNDAGTLVLQEGYTYNAGPAPNWAKYTPWYKVRGTYYSYGVSKSWTGSAYHGHATWTSPRQTY